MSDFGNNNGDAFSSNMLSSIIPDDSPFSSSLPNDDDDINDGDDRVWDLHFALVV